MAYGKKYNYYFQYGYSDSDKYEIAFYFKDYASTVTTLTAGNMPLELNYPGQRDDTKPIMASNIRLNFKVEQADISTFDTDFLETEFKDIVIKIISDPDGTPVTIWTGLNDPSNSYRSWQDYVYIVSIYAKDVFTSLRDYDYSNSGSRYTGFEDFLTIIKTALSKVADITEFQLDFKVQLGVYSNLMTSSENALKENEVAQDSFSVLGSNGYEFDNCYDVLEKVLKNFNCTLKQTRGYYWIQSNAEDDSYYFHYDWATLTQQSRTASDLVVSISGDKYIGSGTLYKFDPVTSSAITLYNRFFQTPLISNGEFTSNITGWSNGRAVDGGHTFNGTFAWYNYPLLSGTLGTQLGGTITATTYSFRTTALFAIVEIGSGAPTVACSWSGELYSESRSGGPSAIPIVRARLWNSTDGYTDGTIGQQPFLSVGGFYTFSDSFDVTGLTEDNNYLEIEVEIQDATTTAVQFYWDNIGVEQVIATGSKDWYYSSVIVSSPYRGNTERDIVYFAETQETVSDICSIKDSGGSYVESWSRYGETSEGLSIIELIQQQRLNHSYKWMNYVRATIKDPTNKIWPENFLTDGSKTYRIIGLTKNFREESTTLDMVEISNTDVTVNYINYKLETEYGKEA